jgi:hypothetical protein
MVRPGITGWAQVNGGALLSPKEKEELDQWYIRHASLWLDLRILVLTVLSLIKGDRRSQPGARPRVLAMPAASLLDDDKSPRPLAR